VQIEWQQPGIEWLDAVRKEFLQFCSNVSDVNVTLVNGKADIMKIGKADPCPRCGAPLVSIHVNLGAGVRTLCSCDGCDRRWWLRNGELIGLSGLLDEVPEKPKRVNHAA